MTRGENPVPFLLHDNGAEARNRMIIFTTKDALHHLAKSDDWYMDGTFSSAPALFEHNRRISQWCSKKYKNI